MRFSKLLTLTLKEAPKDAILPSHIYLIRGGFIYQVASGIYDFLPLGKKVLDKIKNIIKEELDSVGCQEVLLGFVTPGELWKKSERYEKYGAELLRFKDRKSNEFVLGPTHEEMIVELAKQFINSYKQLPINLYQINLKFRDEARPRFGLMRGREFIMKDGYSFHTDYEDMIREFNLMEKTYKKIFTRMGLDFRVVEADSGAIGGEGSKEFMVLSNSGEDTIVVCNECDYAANIEAAKRKTPKTKAEAPEAMLNRFKTKDIKTIEELSKFFGVDPYYLIKAVAKKAIYDDKRSEIVLFFLRGSDELQEVKATNSVGANELVDVTEDELEKSRLVAGFIGPIELIKNIKALEDISLFHEELAYPNIKKVFDKTLKSAKDMICGANEKDYHIVGANLTNLKDLHFADIAQVKEGDRCIKCGGELKFTKGIEVGHIFQLGTRYSKPLKAEFLDQNGKNRPFIMGTYGIGVSRLLAAIIEQHHDDKGSIWPVSVAPFEVVVVVSNIKDKEQKKIGESIYNELKAKGVDALFDDRKERFGFKMKDFELIGIPYAVVIGKKLDDGYVELIKRSTLNRKDIRVDKIVDSVIESIK